MKKTHQPYVYILAYPDGTPFYVGKGTRGRIYQDAQRNEYCRMVCTEIKRAKQLVRRSVVFRGSHKRCLEIEQALVNALGRRLDHTGILTNTLGGGFDHNVPDRTKQKIRDTVKQRWAEGVYGERKSPGTTGMTFKRSDDAREKMRQSALKRWARTNGNAPSPNRRG